MADEPTPITSGTLEERQSRLIELLSAPNYDGDATALVAEANEVRTAIDERNRQRDAQEAARARLTSARFTPAVEAPELDAASEGRAVQHSEMEKRSAAVNDFSTRAGAYTGGKMTMDASWLDTRAVLTGTGSTGTPNTTGGSGVFFPLVPQPGILPVYPDRPLRVADLISRAVTNTPIIEYVRDTTAKGGGTPGYVAEAGVKPESIYTFDLVSDTVRTVAHFTNVTRQAIADVGQLQQYLEGRLLYGLGYKLDSEILNGDGAGIDLRGIFNISGINIYSPAAATTPYHESKLISLRKAMTPIYNAEYAPTGIGMHPQDWADIQLTTNTQGSFLVNPDVANAATPRVWGLDVVQSTAFPVGTALVGDYKLGATLWDRQEATVYVTDSHASNFTANVLTLLAELRVGLSVHRLQAFTSTVFNP